MKLTSQHLLTVGSGRYQGNSSCNLARIEALHLSRCRPPEHEASLTIPPANFVLMQCKVVCKLFRSINYPLYIQPLLVSGYMYHFHKTQLGALKIEIGDEVADLAKFVASTKRDLSEIHLALIEKLNLIRDCVQIIRQEFYDEKVRLIRKTVQIHWQPVFRQSWTFKQSSRRNEMTNHSIMACIVEFAQSQGWLDVYHFTNKHDIRRSGYGLLDA